MVSTTVVESFEGVVEGNVMVTNGSGFGTIVVGGVWCSVVVTVKVPPWSLRRNQKEKKT